VHGPCLTPHHSQTVNLHLSTSYPLLLSLTSAFGAFLSDIVELLCLPWLGPAVVDRYISHICINFVMELKQTLESGDYRMQKLHIPASLLVQLGQSSWLF
jgi:hypothetical protein